MATFEVFTLFSEMCVNLQKEVEDIEMNIGGNNFTVGS